MNATALADAPAVVLEHPPGCRDCEIVINGDARSMLSAGEVARRWGVSTKVVYRLIHEGRLPTLDLRPAHARDSGPDGRSHGGNGDRYRISCCAVRELETGAGARTPDHPK